MKKALLITTVSGFVPQFEMGRVKILQDMGYEVHYASNYQNPSYGMDNGRLDGTGIVRHQVDFVRSPFHVKSNFVAYRQLLQVLKKDSFELVHCHTPMGAILGRLAARKSRRNGTKVFYTAHGFHFYKGAPKINWILYYPIERFMMRYTDVLITITKEDYRRAQTFKIKNDQRVYYIPGVGVDIGKFDNIELSDKKKDDNKFVMISVGELNTNKNHKVVIEAMHRINNSNILYLICGKGPLESELANLVKLYGLEKQVFFLGYRTDIEKLLRESDLFVFPSFREGLSVALQEAMAAGLPAIVSEIRGNRELIDKDKGGWCVAPDNIQQWEMSILAALQADLIEKGKHNQKKINDYSAEKIQKLMYKIYQEALFSGR